MWCVGYSVSVVLLLPAHRDRDREVGRPDSSRDIGKGHCVYWLVLIPLYHSAKIESDVLLTTAARLLLSSVRMIYLKSVVNSSSLLQTYCSSEGIKSKSSSCRTQVCVCVCCHCSIYLSSLCTVSQSVIIKAFIIPHTNPLNTVSDKDTRGQHYKLHRVCSPGVPYTTTACC